MALQIVQPIPESLKYTYEDYAELPEDRNRYEIIDGELYMTPSPLTVHQRVSMRLAHNLEAFVHENNLGELFSAPLDVLLSEHDVVQPDLMFISNDRKAIITEKNIQGAPDLVIEILSKHTKKRDLGIKSKLYARNGVREYWIVFPKEQRIQVYKLAGNQFEQRMAFTRNEILESTLLPGFKLSLASVFAQ